MLFLLVFLSTGFAEETPALAEDADLTEVIEFSKLIGQAAETGQWELLAGLVIMLLIWGGRRAQALNWIPVKAIPWAAAIMGACASLAVGLVRADVPWWEAAYVGLFSGAQATVLWELIFKHIDKGISSEKEE